MVGKKVHFLKTKKRNARVFFERARVFRTRGTRNSASRSAPHARETMVSIAICRAPFGDLGEKPVRGNTASSGKCYEVVMPCLIVEEAINVGERLKKIFLKNVWGFRMSWGTINNWKKNVL